MGLILGSEQLAALVNQPPNTLHARRTPIKVAMLSLPPRTQSLLEFFFTHTGRSSFVAAVEEHAETAIFDLDTPASRDHWTHFHSRTGKPGIALAVKPQEVVGALWVQKPVTPAALMAAAATLQAGPLTAPTPPAVSAPTPATWTDVLAPSTAAEVASDPAAPTAPAQSTLAEAPAAAPAPAAEPVAEAPAASSAEVPVAAAMPDPLAALLAPPADIPPLKAIDEARLAAALTPAAGSAATSEAHPARADAQPSPADPLPSWARESTPRQPTNSHAVSSTAERAGRPTPSPTVKPAESAPTGGGLRGMWRRLFGGAGATSILGGAAETKPAAPRGAAPAVSEPAVAASPVPQAAPMAPTSEAATALKTAELPPVDVPEKAAADASPAATPAIDTDALAEPTVTPPAADAPPLAAEQAEVPARVQTDDALQTAEHTRSEATREASQPQAWAEATAPAEAAIEPLSAPVATDMPAADAAEPAVPLSAPTVETPTEADSVAEELMADIDPSTHETESADDEAATAEAAVAVPAAPATSTAETLALPPVPEAAGIFDPEACLIGPLREAYLVAAKWQVPTQFECPLGAVVVDAERNEAHFPFGIDAMLAQALQPLDRRSKVHTLSAGEFARFKESASAREMTRVRLDNLLWRVGIACGQGRLPVRVERTRPVYLAQWPNLTRVLPIPQAPRIAALWALRGAAVDETVSMLSIKAREVVDFYNGAWALNLITEDGGHVKRAQRKNARNRGMLTRLIGWLRR